MRNSLLFFVNRYFEHENIVLRYIHYFIRNPVNLHKILPLYAKVNSYISLTKNRYRNDLSLRIEFSDGSKPIVMPSPLILSAGGNKSALNILSFESLGFGAIIVGSITRYPKVGNLYPKRLALIKKDKALINNLGLNNPGIDKVVKRINQQILKIKSKNIAIGISVALDSNSKDEEILLEDFKYTFLNAYKCADFIELNLSCPNINHDRVDQDIFAVSKLLQIIKIVRDNVDIRKAVYIKLSPDLESNNLINVLKLAEKYGINGVSLCNTYPKYKSTDLGLATKYSELPNVSEINNSGGISGNPLYKNCLSKVKAIKSLFPQFSIIASGGIDTGGKMLEILTNGADAISILSVLAYRWSAAKKINQEYFDLINSDIPIRN